MQNIIVDKVNDVYIRIDADQSISRELSDYFSFEVPGYKFTPQFRRRVWDGKIRLFHMQQVKCMLDYTHI